MLRAEIPRRLSVANANASVADRPWHDDERRQTVRRPPLQVRHDRAEMRILMTAPEEVASLHHLMAGLVNRRRFVANGT